MPHHDLVGSFRKAYLKEVAMAIQPQTIVILSPDHFDRAKDPLVSNKRTWETKNGEIYSDTDIIDTLGLPLGGDDVFLREHGLTSLLGDIKKFFPNSSLVPVMIKPEAEYKEVMALVRDLYQICPDCLLVSSVDFSHSSSTVMAEIHDLLAISGLGLGDQKLVYEEAEVDSPESLVALMEWARLHGANDFKVFSQTNSGIMSKVWGGEVTSHIIGGYYMGLEVEEIPPGNVSFAIAGQKDEVTTLATADLRLAFGERFFWGVDVSLLSTASPLPDLFLWADGVEARKFLGFQRLKYIFDHSGISNISASKSTDTDKGVIKIVRENFSVVFFNANYLSLDEVSTLLPKYSDSHTVVIGGVLSDKETSSLIDLGVDMIQVNLDADFDFSMYKNRPIIQGLGNYFTSATDDTPSVVLAGYFGRTNLHLSLIPINGNNHGLLPNPAYGDFISRIEEKLNKYEMNEVGLFTIPLNEPGSVQN